VLDVFRFAWFAVRTFAGFVLLVLTIYAALWVFVKIDSMATRNADPDAALRLVKAYNAQRIGQVRKPRACTACRCERLWRGSPCGVSLNRHLHLAQLLPQAEHILRSKEV